MKIFLSLIIIFFTLSLDFVSCIYFKLNEDIEKCFVDELYKGSVLLFLIKKYQ